MNVNLTSLRNRLIGIGIAVFGLVTVILAYALIVRVGSPRPKPERVFNPGPLLGDIVQVEVRNGCGVSGLAGTMTDYLRELGFDVIDFGDYSSFSEEKTRVIDRVGNPDAARQVALALGVSEKYIVEDIREDYFLDVSVVIGKDYQSLYPFSTSE